MSKHLNQFPYDPVLGTAKRHFLFALSWLLVLTSGSFLPCPLGAQDQQQKQKGQGAADLNDLIGRPVNEMAIVVTRFNADYANLTRFYNIPTSPTRHARFRRFYSDWSSALEKVNAEKLSKPAQADLEQLQKRIARELADVEANAKAQAEIRTLVPFAPLIIALAESRQDMDKVDGMKAAAALNTVKLQLQQLRREIDTPKDKQPGAGLKLTKALTVRAAEATGGMRTALKAWFAFYNGYDPAFTWWTADLYKDVDKALGSYTTAIRSAAPDTTMAPTAIQLPEWAKPGDPTNPRPKSFPVTASDAPDLAALISRKPSEMRDVMAKFLAERGGGKGGGGKGGKAPGGAKGKALRDKWTAALAKIDFDKLTQEARVDYVMIKHSLDRDLRRLELQKKSAEAVAKLLPFEPLVVSMEEAVRKKDKLDPAKAAPTLADLRAAIEKAHAAVEGAWKAKDANHPILASRVSVTAATDTVQDLRTSVKQWVRLGSADPQFVKEVAEPAKAVDQALGSYADFLRSTGVPKNDGSGITGRPIGRDALMVELFGEMIAQTPEELLAIADKEYSWCEAEMKKASGEMGFGDDWRKALEKVKQSAVPVGGQPALIRDLAWEAIAYVQKHDLITVPSIAQETWRMQMMTPQRQLVNPFFTGGEVISVSYPTNTMTFDARLQSMRGNNPHFSDATVHHELIPGHHLQAFMNARFGNRRGANTPFWTEGGALYWEFLLYERGFPKTPEDRVGFLFWRMHRCARIEFSLNFHMGKWTPQQCIDFLVEKVGHERDNAAGEVRRSFGTGYGPLYQLAYMIGGKQLWALRKEMVVSGKMTERDFHDKIWQSGNLPIEMVRAIVANSPLTRDWTPSWKFAE